jgi:hypothetical protein
MAILAIRSPRLLTLPRHDNLPVFASSPVAMHGDLQDENYSGLPEGIVGISILAGTWPQLITHSAIDPLQSRLPSSNLHDAISCDGPTLSVFPDRPSE